MQLSLQNFSFAQLKSPLAGSNSVKVMFSLSSLKKVFWEESGADGILLGYQEESAHK